MLLKVWKEEMRLNLGVCVNTNSCIGRRWFNSSKSGRAKN